MVWVGSANHLKHQTLTLDENETNVYTEVDTEENYVMESEIKRWGNSAAVRLTSKILAQANLDVSSPINIDVKAGKIVIDGTTPEAKLIKFLFSE